MGSLYPAISRPFYRRTNSRRIIVHCLITYVYTFKICKWIFNNLKEGFNHGLYLLGTPKGRAALTGFGAGVGTGTSFSVCQQAFKSEKKETSE